MTYLQAKQLIQSDPDFIYSRRYNYSMTELLKRYPDGCPDRISAAVLLVTEEDIESMYQNIVIKLRERMGVR